MAVDPCTLEWRNMNKSLILLTSAALIGVSLWIGNTLGHTQGVVKSITSIDIAAPSPTPPKTIIDNPVVLSIPTLGLQANIEHVGLDDKKRMDVPKDDMNVAWYDRGARIGEKGSAVIAGHFDTKAGGPAVFYEINKLRPGDEIIVSGANGETSTFVVTETKTVKDATFPIEEVFAKNDQVRLNLITCAGTFDRASQNYEDRFVVYTVLKDIS
jgi:hypothetical protein